MRLILSTLMILWLLFRLLVNRRDTALGGWLGARQQLVSAWLRFAKATDRCGGIHAESTQ